jgi:lipopolysaccharide/colanic/teichoic acid biosynthesis glycosyltransferase
MDTFQSNNLAAATDASSASFAPATVMGAVDPAHLASRLTGIMARLLIGRQRKLYDLGKRFLDLILSTGLLALSAPLFVFAALLIRSTSSGPAFFRQERVGQHGAVFTLYKLRTMYQQAPSYGYSPKTGDDPRITRVGRFLRRTSLDELPQLINVLMGQMSLVGPRPEMPFIVEKYTAKQRQRLAIKPGITGLWQISPHRGFPIHEHLEYDFYYLGHRSLSLDVVIVLRTFLSAARGV